MWLTCNDAAKRDFESQAAHSQFGMDILIRSGMIYYKWPNLKCEKLDAFIIYDFEQTVKGPVIGN